MKVAREKIVVLGNALDTLTRVGNTKFAYAVARNMQRAENELKAIDAALKPIPEIDQFNEARLKLCTELAKKDQHGEPVSVNNKYVFENPVEANKKLIELQDEFKDVLDRQKAKAKTEDEAFLKEEIDFEPFIIAEEYVPDNLTADVMKSLMDCAIIQY